MILSVHLADVGKRAAVALLRRRPDPTQVPGLRWAELTLAAALGGGLLPRPQLGRVGLIAAWDDDGPLDAFLAAHPVARRLTGGWRVRLQAPRGAGGGGAPPRPARAGGAALPGLRRREGWVADAEPVAVLTLGRLRLTRAVPFLRTTAAAEAQV